MPDDELLGSVTISQFPGELLPAVDSSLLPQSELDLDDSNTYRWSGATLKQRVGDVLPIVYGRHFMSPSLINAFIEEGEHETLNLLLAWCEGEIESITNIRVNGTPIQELYATNPVDPYGESAEVSVRTGKRDQTPIQGFDDLHSITSVGTVLKQGVSHVFQGTIDDTEFVRLEFEIDRLHSKDLESQTLTSGFVSVRVEIKRSTEQTFQFLGFMEVNKKTTTTFKRYFKTERLTPGRYDIRVTKVSPDADSVLTFGEITLLSMDMISVLAGGLTYPGVSLTGMRLLAFQDLQASVPNITGLVTGKKVRVPKVTFDVGGVNAVDWESYYYDPVAGRYRSFATDALLFWDGLTYHEQWSANPAWCLRDLLLNTRYGLGDLIPATRINEGSFLAASQYYDGAEVNEDGNKEKRFRLDIVLDKPASATDVIGTILKACRGILYNSEQVLRLVVEKEETPKAIFSMGNIVEGSFKLQYLKTKVPNVLAVDFTNDSKEYVRDRVEIADAAQAEADIPANVQTTSFFGAVRLSQVLREGTILLSKLKNNRRVINYSAFFDSVTLQPYDVIEFQHDLPGWGTGGRVEKFCTTVCINLDRDVIIEPGKLYEINVRNPLTDEVESRDVSNIPGVYRSITVATPFTFLAQKNDLWSLGEKDVDLQLYRITALVRNESGRVDITAVEHNNDVYDPSGVIVPEDIYTHLTLEIPKVQNLRLEEVFNRLPNGSIENKIQVSFTFPPVNSKFIKQAHSYEVWISDNGGASWNLVGQTDKEFYTIPELVARGVLYRVAVVSVSENGEKNPITTSPQQTIGVQGFIKPPLDVTGFAYAFTDEIELKWNKNPDTDIAGYEIRTRDDGWLSEATGLVWRGNATKFIIVRPDARSGVLYYIRAFNTSGVVSERSAIVEPVNAPPPAPILTFTPLFQKVFLRWDASTDADVVHYEVWRNDEPDDFIGQEHGEEEIAATVNATMAVLDLPYRVTFFRVAAVDRFGRGLFSNIVRVEQQQIALGEIGPGAITQTEIADDSISTPKLRASAITAEKLAVASVQAYHVSVENLAAISADLGTVRAGTLIGTTIKTSEGNPRIEIDSVALRAFDSLGRQTVKLQSGQLCLIDPTCSECYSFLDAGQLKFHTPFGDVPYATRLCSGVSVSGQSVCLEKWVGRPEVILSIKRLKSYDPTRAESVQEWCVFADNIVSYDFGGANFGWKFDVRSKLVLAGGGRPESIFNLPFDTIRCTGLGTCEIQVSVSLQQWCHQASPDPICYGCLCYAVLYRKIGAGAFCSANFEYLQPHQTCGEIKTTNIRFHTVFFGDTGQWEVKLTQTGRHYVASPFASGSFVTCLCCCQIPVQCSFCFSCSLFCSMSFGAVVSSSTGQVCATAPNFCAFFNAPSTPGVTVLCSRITYTAQAAFCARVFTSTGTNCAFSSINPEYSTSRFLSARTSSDLSYCTASWNANCTKPGFIGSVCFGLYLITCGNAVANLQGSASITNTICARCDFTCFITCCFLCCVFTGTACCCDLKQFRSMRDVTAQEVVLDNFGEVNWLAVAYR